MYCRDKVIYTAGEQEEQTANASLKIKLIFLEGAPPPKKIFFHIKHFQDFIFFKLTTIFQYTNFSDEDISHNIFA